MELPNLPPRGAFFAQHDALPAECLEIPTLHEPCDEAYLGDPLGEIASAARLFVTAVASHDVEVRR